MWLPDQTVNLTRAEAESVCASFIDSVSHGVMSRETFQSAYGRLLWRDGAGGRWMIGPTTRAWFQWDGQSWMPGEPPDVLRRLGGGRPPQPFVDDGLPIGPFEATTPPPPVEAVPQPVPQPPPAQAPQAPAAAPQPAAGVPAPPPASAWMPTHSAPPEGMSTWPEPDPSQPRGPRLGSSLPVRLLELRGAWAYIECSNGWKAWVDARRLISR